MKNFYLFLLIAVSINLSAQTVEKNFVPYYLENNEVRNFERIASKIEAKAIGMGYGGVNQYLTVFNSKNSPVRFKSSATPKFIIQLDEGTDPLDMIIISKADVVKKKKTYRRFIQKGYNMGGSKDISQYLIKPQLVKIKDDLYEMKFDQPLEPGEYSFMPIYKGTEATNILSTNNEVRIYCFGIDQ